MKKFIILITIFMFAFPVLGAGINIKAGDVVPIDGVFYSKREAAAILVDKQLAEEVCDEKLRFTQKNGEIACDLKVKNLQADLKAEKAKLKVVTKTKDEEIGVLYKQIEKQGDYTGLWFMGGVAVGVITATAISFGAFYTVTRATQ